MRRFFRPWVILGGFLLFLASIPLQLRATSQPQFCVSCHEMKPMVATFEHSTHAAVGCMGCHTDPGQINFVKDKIRDGTKDAYLHFLGYKGPYHTTVPNYRCLHCHPTIQTRNSFQQLAVHHDIHVGTLHIPCVKCHLKVGHQTFTIASSGAITHIATRFEQTHRPVTLQTCFAAGCHDSKAAPTACVTCHLDIQRVKPRTHTAEWLTRHGAFARADATGCTTCHKAAPTLMLVSQKSMTKEAVFNQLLGSQFCSNCHARQNPHPTGFQRTHGQIAMANSARCVACHTDTKQFCGSCHTKQNPHPTDWKQTHGVIAKVGTAKCVVCHTDRKQFCDSCHKMPMPHPAGFVHGHGDLAKAAGANCLSCHQKTDCASCHRTIQPETHTASFVQKHKGPATAAGADCTFCHAKRDCDGCHHAALPASHTAKWRDTHGAVAKKGAQNCMMCHQQASCNACHQLPMPHPAKYQATHVQDASHHEAACANCHRKSYCTRCHENDEIHIPNVRLPDGEKTPLARRLDTESGLLLLVAQRQQSQGSGRCTRMQSAP